MGAGDRGFESPLPDFFNPTKRLLGAVLPYHPRDLLANGFDDSQEYSNPLYNCKPLPDVRGRDFVDTIPSGITFWIDDDAPGSAWPQTALDTS